VADVWLPVGLLLGSGGLSLAELECERGANTVGTCIVQRISRIGLGAAAPSQTYMDPPVINT
jgi:hypothetical protein